MSSFVYDCVRTDSYLSFSKNVGVYYKRMTDATYVVLYCQTKSLRVVVTTILIQYLVLYFGEGVVDHRLEVSRYHRANLFTHVFWRYRARLALTFVSQCTLNGIELTAKH